MIYLIGGAARVGKTTLAKMIMERKKIPFVSTDMLWPAFKDSQPEKKWQTGWEHIPDQFFSFLRIFIDHTSQTLPDYVIEGDRFFPSHVATLAKEFKIKTCFLGSSNMNIADIKKYAQHNLWVNDLSEEHQADLPKKLMADSAMFKREAEKFDFPYFDLAENREEKMEAAYHLLFP